MLKNDVQISEQPIESENGGVAENDRQYRVPELRNLGELKNLIRGGSGNDNDGLGGPDLDD